MEHELHLQRKRQMHTAVTFLDTQRVDLPPPWKQENPALRKKASGFNEPEWSGSPGGQGGGRGELLFNGTEFRFMR